MLSNNFLVSETIMSSSSPPPPRENKKEELKEEEKEERMEEKIVRFPRWGLISRVYEKNGYTIETLGPKCVRTKSQM